MACTGAPSFDPPVGGCPLGVADQGVAWGFVGTTAFLATGGLYLFWIRRREPLVMKRDWVSAFFCVFVAVATQLSCYFALSMPCWTYYAVNYSLSALVPGLMMTRFLGLYARHLRQDEVARTPATRASLAKLSGAASRVAAFSLESSPRALPAAASADAGAAFFYDAVSVVRGSRSGPGSAGAPSPPPKALGFYALYNQWLARFLLHYRFDIPRRSVCATLLPLSLWIFYAMIRFASSPEHRSTNAGCQFDRIDVALSVVMSCLAMSTGLPVIVHLLELPDTLLLRFECFWVIFIWPPLLAWLLSDLSLPDGAHTALHGIYAILIGCYLVLGSMIWLPALLTFSRRRTRIVVPLGARIVATHEKVLASALPTSARSTTASIGSPTRPGAMTGILVYGIAESDTCAPAAERSEQVPQSRTPSETSQANEGLGNRSPQGSLSDIAYTAMRFVFPAPSPDELLATLRMPTPDIRESSRAISVVGAMLFATDSGRTLLYETLRLDLSAEFIGFLVDCEDVRRTAEAWLPLVIVSEGPTEPMHRAGPALFSKISVDLSLLVARYVDFNAPHYVSINSGDAAALSEAAKLLPSLVARAGESAEVISAAIAAVERVLVALANAAVDVFAYIADPLRLRMTSRADLFDKWAAGVLQTAATLQDS